MSVSSRFMWRLRGQKFKDYRLVCWRFAKYLDSVEGKTLTLNGYDTATCQKFQKEIPYITRFSEIYIKSLYAKFSQLEEWYNEHKTSVYLLSLTTSSRDKTIKQAFETLRNGWRKLAHTLRKIRDERGIELEYIYVYEPHQSGYPHMHVVLFGDLTDADFERIRKLWSGKYKIGSYEHGLHISKPKKHQEIEHVRAYILKYVQKSIDISKMDISHFVFLAVLWSFYDKTQWTKKIPRKTRTGRWVPESTGGGAFRLWSASRALTTVMKPKTTEIDATDYSVNYARYGEEIPEILEEISERSLERVVSTLYSTDTLFSLFDYGNIEPKAAKPPKPDEKG